MKTDSAASRSLSHQLSAEAFQAFFETLESPAAVCDTQLRLLAANPAFEVLCGNREVSGQTLNQLLSVAAPVPPDGGSTDIDLPLSSGQSVTLTLSRRGDTVAVLARNLGQAAMGGSLAAAGRALMEQARVEQALLMLSREVAGSTSEEELVAVVARGVKGLFPGRTFCLRISDPRSGALTSLYAEGRLRDGIRDVLYVKRSAATKTHLDVKRLPAARVQLVDGGDLPLIFVGSVRGISAPLVASGELFGVINVEYPEGITADVVADDRVLTQLANHLAVGIRNTKLIDELTFIRKYLEELLEHANALILVANRDRRVMVFNRQLARLTGFEKSEVLGKDILEYVPESERMPVMRVIAQSLRGEAVSNFETRIATREGSEVRVSFATSAMLAPDGDVEGVVAIGQDLTAVKEMERRAIHAEKLASLGQLAASVVHEINNPMTAIATYSDAMLKRSLTQPNADPHDQEKLKKILENVQRILRFTHDLVSYARPAKEKAEEVDIHTALDLAVTFCDHVLNQHGIKIERAYGELPAFKAVKGNLVQVFVNLITNACHAMKPGGVVKLSTALDGDRVAIRVADSGTGIDPKNRDRIFEPFFTTKSDGKGTGLGLSIVQQIVDNHGGSVDVESALGVGTTFVIRLPLQRE